MDSNVKCLGFNYHPSYLFNNLGYSFFFPTKVIKFFGILINFRKSYYLCNFTIVVSFIYTGTSAQAANIWPGPDDLYKWKWEQLTKYVVTSLGSFGPDISHEALRLYNVSEKNGILLLL